MADDRPIAQECVEGYLYVPAPLQILLLRRPPDRGRIWVPVSGKVEPSDRSWVAALLREIDEETALPAASVRPLDWEVPFDGPDGRRWRLRAFAVGLDGRWSPRLSPEHEAFAWVSAEEARRRLHYEDNRAAVDRLLGRLVPTERGRPTEGDAPPASSGVPPPLRPGREDFSARSG